VLDQLAAGRTNAEIAKAPVHVTEDRQRPWADGDG
jgi:hypothetical protein